MQLMFKNLGWEVGENDREIRERTEEI